MRTQKGMTLVELMVSLMVVLVVLGGAGAAYLKLLKGFKAQGRIAESYIENLCGLELLRYDIELAGYGLPSDIGTATYTEAKDAVADDYNDAPNRIPRAFAFSNNGGSSNSDVLVIKSLVANMSTQSGQTGRKWSLIYNTDPWGMAGSWVVQRSGDSTRDLAANDTFIVLNANKKLNQKGASNSTNWYASFNSAYYTGTAETLLDPAPPATIAGRQQIFLVYGVEPNGAALSMPFNRVDYYLDASNLPDRCSPNSFVLTRATIRHADGLREPQALMDCVRDFQLAFGLDTDGDGGINSWLNDLNGIADLNGNGVVADEIALQLKEVRMFILYHEGQRDNDYASSGTLTLGDTTTGALSTFTPGGGDIFYRWKVIQIAVKPMNLR